MVKNLQWGDVGSIPGPGRFPQFLDREDPLEKEIANHSSMLAWTIPRTEESGKLQSIRLQRVGHNGVTEYACTCSILLENH